VTKGSLFLKFLGIPRDPSMSLLGGHQESIVAPGRRTEWSIEKMFIFDWFYEALYALGE
jgi:hypothetical protein